MEVMNLSQFSKGMGFPEYKYTLSEDIVKNFLAGVEESNPLYTDKDYAEKSSFGSLVVPPTTISLYVTPSSVLKTIGKKTPPGLIQAGQKYEFHRPIKLGDTVTVKSVVEDVVQKRVVLSTVASLIAPAADFSKAYIFANNVSKVNITLVRSNNGDEYMHLAPGQWAWFPWSCSVDLMVDAASGSPVLEVAIFEV